MTMIAPVSSRNEHIRGTIRTCKYAIDLLPITGNAKGDVSLDRHILITQLLAKIVRLKHLLAIPRSGAGGQTPPVETDRLVCSPEDSSQPPRAPAYVSLPRALSSVSSDCAPRPRLPRARQSADSPARNH